MSKHTWSDRHLPTYKKRIAVTATIFFLFQAKTTDATFVAAANRVGVVAVNTILVDLRLSKTGRTVGRTDCRSDGLSIGWMVGRTDASQKLNKNYKTPSKTRIRTLQERYWMLLERYWNVIRTLLERY